VNVPFTKQTLGNGLDVIVHEDHRMPLVAVSVWYHVGSKNERADRTGLAHLFEHLMFKGSAHQPRTYFEPLQEAGGSLNGSTSTDRTNYWELMPAGALRLALWMEADRMGWLLPALSEASFETERDVVLNERRQNYENRPYGMAPLAIMSTIFPADHPYHWPTIGYAEHLHAATVDDARAFFSRYYHPGNASLVIAGNVAAGEAFLLAEELFGNIPGGPPVAPLEAVAVPAARRRIFLEDRVELPRLYLAWPAPPLFEEDDAELDLVADLLANGRTSRLYRRLIHDERIATELAASQSSRELASTFQIVATAAPGYTLDDVEAAIRDELTRVIDEGVDEDELERGRAQAEAAFVYRLQSLGGFGGRSDQLNAYNVYRRDPDYFDADLERYLRASRDGLRRAAERWIDPDRSVALSVVPHGAAEQALAESAPAEGVR
jgi:zinc protease